MNKVILTGRLTRDPELNYTTGEKATAVCSFTVAVDRRYKSNDQTADFIRCKAFGKLGETIGKYFSKGRKIDLCGRIETGSYTNRDGQKVYTTDVIVEDFEFGESKNASGGGNANPTQSCPKFTDIPDGVDEELPFA